MSGRAAALTVMKQPVDPLATDPPPDEPSPSTSNIERTETAPLSPEESLPERIFTDKQGVRLGWRLFVYFSLVILVARLLGWLGQSFFPDTGSGVVRLWQEFYGEVVSLAGSVIAALVVARIEHRSVDTYGLPRAQAFGRWFWIGAIWGLIGITALLGFMHGAHVFDFGRVVLHGPRVWKFAVFWGAYFVMVALFEEFLFRGYFQFVLTERAGFWPTALLGSAMFGAVHLGNAGEGPAGALGAALIGLFLCLTLRRTGSLWFAVGFHAAWDWGETFLYAVPNSGTTEPGHLLSPSVHGSHWLTGGSVGPEASALLLLVLAGLWVAFDRSYRSARYGVSAQA
jgi:membrane protease YdiL (CAAX protease family)